MKKTFIIAEAGVNHNGSLDLARQLIDVAARARADAVKFQTFRAGEVISSKAPKAIYQRRTTGTEESQLEMVRKLELDENAHRSLIDHCRSRGIQFLSTPFDLKSVDLLAVTLDLPQLKLASGEITNGPLLLKAARTGKPIILSTGMSTLEEVETALGVLAFGYARDVEKPSLNAFASAYRSEEGRRALRKKVSLLHCTTEYPAPYDEVNLRAMETLRVTFGLPVGLSDHTTGIAVPIAAVALGAVIIEKHFTMDHDLPGPDHRASLEPDELDAMVAGIRQVEAALGSPQKMPAPAEMINRDIVRRSLVAACDIQKGDVFTEKTLAAKRPGTGISPLYYWQWIGRHAERDYREDEIIES